MVFITYLRLFLKKNNIDTIYFGKNGLGCNADDNYTESHVKNDIFMDILPNLFTPENKIILQKEFENVLSMCPNLTKIFICGYNFQCDTDTLFFKINKKIKVYKIYNYEISTVKCQS